MPRQLEEVLRVAGPARGQRAQFFALIKQLAQLSSQPVGSICRINRCTIVGNVTKEACERARRPHRSCETYRRTGWPRDACIVQPAQKEVDPGTGVAIPLDQ